MSFTMNKALVIVLEKAHLSTMSSQLLVVVLFEALVIVLAEDLQGLLWA